MNCPKCNKELKQDAPWDGRAVSTCKNCRIMYLGLDEEIETITIPAGKPGHFTVDHSQMNPEYEKQIEVANKLGLITAWLDEYHMAFKDAKRWRREFEKFLTSIL